MRYRNAPPGQSDAEYSIREKRLATRLRALFRTIEGEGRCIKSIRDLRREAMAWQLAGHTDIAGLLRGIAAEAERDVRFAAAALSPADFEFLMSRAPVG